LKFGSRMQERMQELQRQAEANLGKGLPVDEQMEQFWEALRTDPEFNKSRRWFRLSLAGLAICMLTGIASVVPLALGTHLNSVPTQF